MIDRKALWITALFLVLMLAAAIWRIALLPDWTLYSPTGAATTVHSHRALFLFNAPVWLLVFAGLIAWRGWMAREPQKLPSWRNWSSFMLVSCGVLVTLMQLFMIARSLGWIANLSPLAVTRAGFVVIGSLMMVAGNQMPKLPWLQSRLGLLRLDNDQGARLLRFRGRLSVAIGFLVVIEGAFLPLNVIMPVMTATLIGSIAVNLLRTMQLKRGQAE